MRGRGGEDVGPFDGQGAGGGGGHRLPSKSAPANSWPLPCQAPVSSARSFGRRPVDGVRRRRPVGLHGKRVRTAQGAAAKPCSSRQRRCCCSRWRRFKASAATIALSILKNTSIRSL